MGLNFLFLFIPLQHVWNGRDSPDILFDILMNIFIESTGDSYQGRISKQKFVFYIVAHTETSLLNDAAKASL